MGHHGPGDPYPCLASACHGREQIDFTLVQTTWEMSVLPDWLSRALQKELLVQKAHDSNYLLFFPASNLHSRPFHSPHSNQHIPKGIS